MIDRLVGRLVSTSPRCVVAVGGVGFELHVPQKDLERLGPDAGEVTFHTYLHVREDRLQLYGFLDPADRELFVRLLDVSGVGPRLALGALSAHPAARIVAAIRGGDRGFLATLSGVGRRLAERLCTELGDRLDDLEAHAATGGEAAPAAGARAGAAAVREEVLLALTSLGMTRGAAERVIERVEIPADGSANVEDVVREALRLAGGA